MKIYGQSTCKTTRKVRAWLKDHNIDYDFHDFRKVGVSAEKLQEWDNKVGYQVFLNKKSTAWRQLDPQIKEAAKSSAGTLALLEQNSGIIKRAVVEDDDFLFFGFDEKIYKNHFLNN
ncbi:Spx/MgsR family RNA polymerase-binding regulatory protein [Dyadobacter subterraneus]|uniref:Spx/MgsR family RNA polymerase-binding regulatory protein n=1 Tax=Dyadobacter subterraneus TaxID=2773304 RepID=A0ABR9W7B4_9BACT|nr:Spx/MgsR family RNA polymerase-binding regulatory protein [Dyadobacter subterraneus]MBE9461348.1 Spx/MgsR family RNA polymerase-binding regulatory protein [Dyadobacter subterraneus]